MRPNPQFPADLVTFTEEILDGKLHFLCSVTRVLFPFLKFGVTQAIFSLLFGKTPFAKEVLKMGFRIRHFSSDTFLTISADISPYPELMFVLRLTNAFSRTNSVRLMGGKYL